MKDQDILLNTLIESEELLNGYTHEEIGDDHLFTGLETPMKPNAFAISDEEKKERIAQLFAQGEELNVLRYYFKQKNVFHIL